MTPDQVVFALAQNDDPSGTESYRFWPNPEFSGTGFGTHYDDETNNGHGHGWWDGYGDGWWWYGGTPKKKGIGLWWTGDCIAKAEAP